MNNNPPVKMKVRLHLKLKQVLSWTFNPSQNIKLFGSTKSKITENENGKNLPHLEITEVVLLFTFVSNKPCGQVLDISPKNVTFLKIFKLEFSYIAVWFTDQKSKPPEIEDKVQST